jgi:SAM-dependent methyltransferase
MSGTAPPQKCLACGRLPEDARMLPQGVRIVRCPGCGLEWWRWPAFDPETFYDQAYFQSVQVSKGYDDYAALEPGVRRTARARLGRIARLRRSPPGRLLDVGCGTGCFVDEARHAGWDARGIEVSPYAAAVASERGLPVTCQSIEALRLEPSSLDAVTLWDVLEHVTDPAGALAQAASALRPGGVLALSTGDVSSWCARWSGARWHLYNIPEHLFFFSRTALVLMLERSGCRVLRIVREVNWVPLAYVFERLRKTLRRPRPARPTPTPSAPLVASRDRRVAARWLVPATLLDVLGLYALRLT